VRDSFLGAIWEGSSNVVALDVQRAVLKDGALTTLGALITDRLREVSEPSAKPWVEVVQDGLAIAERRASEWTRVSDTERELHARPAADLLYHVLVGSLLLAEGQRLLDRRGSWRKLVVAALYL